MWAVLYDDGMSLTTASERIARSLAEAERQRGRSVTVRRLDNVETHPRGTEKPARPPGPGRGDGPVRPRGTDKVPVPGPSKAVGPEPISEASPPELTGEPEPARAATPARRRRLVLYALAAASIIVAAALADHWGVLPRVGASTSSSSTQVGGPPHRPQLIPPLDQPPVMHVGNAVNATAESAGGGP
jgi:hypothetical protein